MKNKDLKQNIIEKNLEENEFEELSEELMRYYIDFMSQNKNDLKNSKFNKEFNDKESQIEKNTFKKRLIASFQQYLRSKLKNSDNKDNTNGNPSVENVDSKHKQIDISDNLQTSKEVQESNQELDQEESNNEKKLTDLKILEKISQVNDATTSGDSNHKNKNSDSKENNKPKEIYIVPVKEKPFFPGQTLPVLLHHKTWIDTFNKLKDAKQRIIGFLMVKQEFKDLKEPNKKEHFHQIGTLVYIHEIITKNGNIQFIAEGLRRFKVEELKTETPPYNVAVSYPKDQIKKTLEYKKDTKALTLALNNSFRELLELNPYYNEDLKFFLGRFTNIDSHLMADFAVSITNANAKKLQEILDTIDVNKRLNKALEIFAEELDIAKIKNNIQERVEENVDSQQRKFFLRQQLQEIQKELGTNQDDRNNEALKYQQKLKSLKFSPENSEKINEEIDKLQILEQQAPEYAITKTWLDLATGLPWGKTSKDRLDIKRTKSILNKYHYGQEDIKDRIVEFIALAILKKNINGAIICLVGPPGVGKTSISKSVATAINRKLYRLSVGGMHDEAEIKGHRKTYIGAMPGKIIQAIKETKVANPVIVLDEIDKMGTSYRGDPASALLEVLDPEQNNNFLDHYLDLRFDLSQVMFICTANQLDTIPEPLLDRMEVIHIPGYITAEKVEIARKHLLPKIFKESNISKNKINITKPALVKITEKYARESGVRDLEKQLKKLVRKFAVKLVENKDYLAHIKPSTLEGYLGKEIFSEDKIQKTIGTATGLAWTAMGGTTLVIEASLVHSLNRGFKVTGQLGEVMEESSQIAYSYICANLKKYKANKKFFDEAFIHLHVPDGATPKDGPSAGITIASALLSLAKQQKLNPGWAMTGELSLTGLVLPVGGTKEKIIAAKRNKINNIIIPKQNKKDYDELPEYIKQNLNMHFVSNYLDVYKLLF